jgi:hypothetical protein
VEALLGRPSCRTLKADNEFTLPPSPRQRMMIEDEPLEALLKDMGVNLGRGDVSMAQKLLHSP